MVISHRWYSLPLAQFFSLKFFSSDPPVSSPGFSVAETSKPFSSSLYGFVCNFILMENLSKANFVPESCYVLHLHYSDQHLDPMSFHHFSLWHPREHPQNILRKINYFRSLNVRLHLKYLIFMHFDNQKCRWHSSC